MLPIWRTRHVCHAWLYMHWLHGHRQAAHAKLCRVSIDKPEHSFVGLNRSGSSALSQRQPHGALTAACSTAHLLLRTPSVPQQLAPGSAVYLAPAQAVHLAPPQAARLRRRSTRAPFAQLAAALAPPPCLYKGPGILPEAAAAHRCGTAQGRLPRVHHLSTGAPLAQLPQHANGLPAAPACVALERGAVILKGKLNVSAEQ